MEQLDLAPIYCISAIFPLPNYLLKMYVISSIHHKANCGMQATIVTYKLWHPTYKLDGFIWFLHQVSSNRGKTNSTKQLVSQVSVPQMGPEKTSQWCALALKPDCWEHRRNGKVLIEHNNNWRMQLQMQMQTHLLTIVWLAKRMLRKIQITANARKLGLHEGTKP